MYKCPFKFFLGVSCPGCGMTRALFYAVTLRFKEAFHFHPLFPLVILWGLGLLLYHFKLIHPKKITQNILIYSTIAVFFAVYFMRLITGSDVVSIDPTQSIIYRIIFRFGYSS